MKHLTITLLFLCAFTTAQASALKLGQQDAHDTTFLSVEQAFIPRMEADASNLYLEIAITNQCCYLYQKSLNVESKTDGIQVALPTLPVGIEKEDEVFGPMIVYEDTLAVTIPRPAAAAQFDFVLHYQGCAKSGFCYPPVSQAYHVDKTIITAIDAASATTMHTTPLHPAPQHAALTPAHFDFFAFLKYFTIGLLLALTPCVLPMLPILSGIILGQKNIGWKRSLGISLSYVLAMSVTYAAAGILAATLGVSLQGMLQTPWVIGSFALLLVLMALWLFEVINLSGLNHLYNKIEPWTRQRRWANAYVSAAIMGVLATLIASPCVTAPLVGVLSYIAQTQDRLHGGLALFSMGLGLGVPLLLVAVLGPQVLPKKGAWMQQISHAFGVMLIGLAIYLLERVLPGQITLGLWALWCIWISYLLGIYRNNASFYGSRLGTLALVYGLLLGVGVFHQETSPGYPLRMLQPNQVTTVTSEFVRVTDLQSLQAHLLDAKSRQQPVFLDFYADWCVACQHMERYFQDPQISAQLASWKRLQVDLSTLTPEIRQIMTEYQVIAPPTFIFYDANGNYLSQNSVVGEITKEQLQQVLQTLNAL